MKLSIPWLMVGGAVVFLVGEIISHRSTGRESGGASGYSASNPTAMVRSESARPSARDEGVRQLEEDLNRTLAIVDAKERDDVLSVACLRWAEFDPLDALRIARSVDLDQVSTGVCEDILQKWAEKDFAGASAWVGREPAGEPRDHLMARLAFVEARTQPAAAARLVAEQIPAGAVQTEAGFSVLHQWALQDLSAALAWANSFPPALQVRGRAELADIVRFRLAARDAPR